ncbi:MAG: glucokinase [Desulfobulbaceae bacterium]|uniref:Glucokinase n=1 Tax=Candidatus Desulfobia pelagia TaxID=2841692 RepID=A0A8J6TG32_9BACT|nr:glucokinase [Candidatus Desulfobia pelagia]
MAYILAADIGGTKTNIGIFDSKNLSGIPLVDETVLCKNYSDFNELLEDFLGGKKYPIEFACFAAAGPVRGGRVHLTNIPWVLDENELKNFLDIQSVYVINDLVALAYSIFELAEKDAVTLHEGVPEKNGTIGLVAPGTGLGMAFLVWDGSKYIACPSEGGHASFSPDSDLEIQLLQYFKDNGHHVSIESLCSGPGIYSIYSFLKAKKGFEEPGWFKKLLGEAADPTPVIVDIALDPDISMPICTETLDLFVTILTGLVNNLSLTVMATGGIYIGGGIPVKIITFLQQVNFPAFFEKRANMSTILESIPVKVVVNPKSSLHGAVRYAFSKLQVGCL